MNAGLIPSQMQRVRLAWMARNSEGSHIFALPPLTRSPSCCRLTFSASPLPSRSTRKSKPEGSSFQPASGVKSSREKGGRGAMGASGPRALGAAATEPSGASVDRGVVWDPYGTCVCVRDYHRMRVWVHHQRIWGPECLESG